MPQITQIVILILVSAVALRAELMPSEQARLFLEASQDRTARLRGAERADLAGIKVVLVDCSRDIGLVSNAQDVRYLGLRNFTGWNDALRELYLALTGLEYFDARGVATELSDSWNVLLTSRNLRYCKIELAKVDMLPSWFSELRNLVGLDLSGNRLREIPSALLALSRLEELNLSENSIAIVAENLAGLRSLAVLDLSHNSIRLVADDGAMPPRLMTLDLANNKLERFPMVVGANGLVTLKLEYNYFTSIPTEWFASTRVRKISISRYCDGTDAFQSRPDVELVIFGPEDAIPRTKLTD